MNDNASLLFRQGARRSSSFGVSEMLLAAKIHGSLSFVRHSSNRLSNSPNNRLNPAIPITCLSDLSKKPVPTKLNNLQPKQSARARVSGVKATVSVTSKPLRIFSEEWLPSQSDVVVSRTPADYMLFQNTGFESLVKQSLPNYTGNAQRNRKLIKAIVKTVSENQGYFVQMAPQGLWGEVDTSTAEQFTEVALLRATSKEQQIHQMKNQASHHLLFANFAPPKQERNIGLWDVSNSFPALPQHTLVNELSEQSKSIFSSVVPSLSMSTAGLRPYDLAAQIRASLFNFSTPLPPSPPCLTDKRSPPSLTEKRSEKLPVTRDALRLKFKRPKREASPRK